MEIRHLLLPVISVLLGTPLSGASSVKKEFVVSLASEPEKMVERASHIKLSEYKPSESDFRRSLEYTFRLSGAILKGGKHYLSLYKKLRALTMLILFVGFDKTKKSELESVIVRHIPERVMNVFYMMVSLSQEHFGEHILEIFPDSTEGDREKIRRTFSERVEWFKEEIAKASKVVKRIETSL